MPGLQYCRIAIHDAIPGEPIGMTNRMTRWCDWRLEGIDWMELTFKSDAGETVSCVANEQQALPKEIVGLPEQLRQLLERTFDVQPR